MATNSEARAAHLRSLKVGDPIAVEVINRVDPLYGQTLNAVVTKITGPSRFGVIEVWWEVPGERDHMGMPRFGAEGVSAA